MNQVQCTKDEIQRIAMMRDKGYSYERIGRLVGRYHSTVRKYHRIFDRYGYDVFPERIGRSDKQYAESRRPQKGTGGYSRRENQGHGGNTLKNPVGA